MGFQEFPQNCHLGPGGYLVSLVLELAFLRQRSTIRRLSPISQIISRPKGNFLVMMNMAAKIIFLMIMVSMMMMMMTMEIMKTVGASGPWQSLHLSNCLTVVWLFPVLEIPPSDTNSPQLPCCCFKFQIFFFFSHLRTFPTCLAKKKSYHLVYLWQSLQTGWRVLFLFSSFPPKMGKWKRRALQRRPNVIQKIYTEILLQHHQSLSS